MPDTEEQRALQAKIAGKEDIVSFVHDVSPRVIRMLLTNEQLTEKDILIIANRKNLPGDIFEAIAKDARWAENYPLKLTLAKNPRTPLFVSLSIVRYLRLFDLADMTRAHALPVSFRKKIEAMLIEKLPTLPLGIKKTLAKRTAGTVLFKMMQEKNIEVVKLCLQNPHMQEQILFRIINRRESFEETIRSIAEHPSWSNRALIRFSLVRNHRTPLARSSQFIHDMRTIDLRDLYADPAVSITVKPFILRELRERGESPVIVPEEDRVYEIGEEEVKAAENDGGMEEFEEQEED